MALKLSVGLAKKIGLPKYSSLAASCHVEVELDGSLIFHDLETFHCHVREAYSACSQAVRDELARQLVDGTVFTRDALRQGDLVTKTTADVGVGQGGNSNGNAFGDHCVTPRQLAYAGQLADQIRGLGVGQLDRLTNQMFAKAVADLTSQEASALIATLKRMKIEQLDLDAAPNTSAA